MLLLSTTHKLMERVLLVHLIPIFEAIFPKEQASFKPGQSYYVTSYIEVGWFPEEFKTQTELVDLSHAYNMVWRDGV